MVSTADIVVLCAAHGPRRPASKRERLRALKPGAILVNVSRGPVVDDGALIEALGWGVSAALPLTCSLHSPSRPKHPYFRLDNVIGRLISPASPRKA
ncbi:hypothetical protein F2981_27765 (plasmid) [Sinorhizobium meliloti]|nr:hypothetical protein [Sinorhizobium meliloti]